MTTHASLLRATIAVLGLLLALLLGLLLTRPAAADAQPPPSGDWQLPLPGSPTVLRPFDPPAKKWSAGHRGVDLGAALGTDVLAAGSGVVAYAGRVAGRGVVSIEHGDLRTTYQSVRAAVRAGQAVSAGDVIGAVLADQHCKPHNCLHWGLLRGETYLDPMTLLHGEAPRLLPVWGIPSGAAVTAEPTGTPTWRRAERPGNRPAVASSPLPSRQARTQHASSSPGAAVGALAATAGAAAIGVAVSRRTTTPRSAVRAPP